MIETHGKLIGSRLAYLLLVAYCLATVLVPVFIVNKIIFLPLFVISVCVFFVRPIATIAPFLVVLIFLYGYLFGCLNGADTALGQQMLFSSSALLLIYYVDFFKIDMSGVVKLTGAIFATLMSGLCFLLMVLPGTALGNELLNFYNLNELGFYGTRNFGGLQMFMLHHRSSPFLLIPLSLFFMDYLRLKKLTSLFFIAVILTAIVCSASRALVAMALISLSVLYFFNKSFSIRLMLIMLTIPILIFCVGYLTNETSVLSSDEKSNSIKIGHLISFVSVVDWKMLMFGQGLGAYFFTEGYAAVVSQTEITWMDSIRFFGLPLSIVLLAIIFFPARYIPLGSNGSSSRVVMFLYIIMSMSNPVLFNSFGFLVVLWYWSIIMRGQRSPIAQRQKIGE